MDEIQNCIADAQYGEALRGMEKIRPVEKFPEPPEGFIAADYAVEQKVTLKSALAEPLGTYYLRRFAGKGAHEEIFDCLEGLRDFQRSADKNAKELISRALKKLPAKFKRLDSFLVLNADAESEREGKIQAESVSEPPTDSITVNVDETKGDDVPPITDSGQNITNSSLSTTISSSVTTTEKKFNEQALKELEQLLIADVEKFWEPFTHDMLFERYMKLKWYCLQHIELRDFTIFRDLGRGAFGVVSGARLNTTGSMVAIKCLNRKLVKGKKAIKLVQAEKDILALLGDKPSHFTIWLKYAWQDRDMFYLALPLATGGDLMYHLQHQGYFALDRTRFTAAEIGLGLNHLHSLGIIYRDLKPENILLSDDGHAHISDMGLAINAAGQKIRGRAGTPGYWAPEMLQKQKYGPEVDWWSFGCCIYEFLSGRCPFSKQNTKMERDDATLTWEITYPTYIGFEEKVKWPEDATDLLSKLLQREPQRRLGRGRRGFENIKQHPFFTGIDWEKMVVFEQDPPWLPRKEAINAVNQSELDEKNNEYDYRKLKLTPEDSIADFEYVSAFAHQQDVIAVLELEANGQLEYLERPSAPTCCCSVS